MKVPCGQCIGCRMDRASDWATRIHHEAAMHLDNCFLTLTYNDEHLPDDYSVSVREVQLFIKRLRKKLGGGVRYFAVGEYGEGKGRPHYHVLLFGHAFLADRTLWRQTPQGYLTYRSATLEALWPYGFSEIGTVSLDSAGYVARYCLKKVNGKDAAAHYQRIHDQTGELVEVAPEFAIMSNRPGIGGRWFEQFRTDAFPSDFVVIQGQKKRIPRYYKKLFDRTEPDNGKLLSEGEMITMERIRKSRKHADNNTPERLATRREVAELRVERLKRDIG